MKLSRQWLSDYVDLSGLSDEELVRRLTDIGHALEGLETHGDDTIFDLEITTNRVDAMSHLGMAREPAHGELEEGMAACLGESAKLLHLLQALRPSIAVVAAASETRTLRRRRALSVLAGEHAGGEREIRHQAETVPDDRR